MNPREIRKRALRKRALLEKKRRDPRYQAVLGRLVREGLLIARRVHPTRLRPTVEDALWAGEVEPRVLELLPAILARRPKLFLQAKALPEDLAIVVRELKRGKTGRDFRGVPPEKYAAWEEVVKVRGPRKAAIAKNFRFQEEDLEKLEKLRKKWGMSETEVIRKALRICGEELASG